jgi:hypothetical protein
MKKIILVLLFMSSGCATVVKTKSTLNADEIKQKLSAKGGNTISGSALIRQMNGGVVTCAGGAVGLIPVNEYSKERIMTIYGNDVRGFNPVGRKFVFQPEYPEYSTLHRVSVCDAQGFFNFSDVADGEYFVITAIEWHINAYKTSGGGLFHKVQVSGDKEFKITLSP